ncbi:hypothetical protein PV11_00247 [Exophiala sideris]|uniref:Large ribosomal subunit protein mL50 n=1 Tax=Exophiala sideris TaxID=1016849 RepID=A0A0D1X9I3_9EURO|nr:hypothetical protein PV11_00247 [Exophiala sideris]
MAAPSYTSRSVHGIISKVITPNYICRTCRNHLQSRPKQVREISSANISPSLRRKSCSTVLPQRTASYASRAGQDNISPREFLGEEAPLVDMEPYNEARSWEGLEHVGHKGHWKDLPARPEDQFNPWLSQPTSTTPDRTEFLKYLYVAIVETLAAKQAARVPTSVKGVPTRIDSLRIALTTSGTLSHLEDTAGLLNQRVIWRSKQVSAEAMQQLSGAKFDFNNPITFTILKRFSQLSHHRVPDPILNTVIRNNKTVTEFVGLLTESARPKPKKTADVLIAKQQKALDLAAGAREVEVSKTSRKTRQPLGANVMVLSRRETPVDKEKEIGRWKVIERELKSKGLPVLGRKPLVPHNESEWVQTI